MVKIENIAVVLVEPKNPGNIGSVARAMKNMGINRLILINPVNDYRINNEQKKMGYRSQEIIENSIVFSTLKEAVAQFSAVFLATARQGKWKREFFTPRSAAELMLNLSPADQVALVFGREDKGVTIDEAQLANYYIKIPAAVSYPSLNLAQAVMVTVYEVYQALSSTHSGREKTPQRASKEAFIRIADNIWQLMQSLEVRETENGLFHRSLKRALNRTNWTKADVAVFDRFCKQVRWYLKERCRKNGEQQNGA